MLSLFAGLAFGVCLAVLLYIYAGFPVILWLLTRRKPMVIPESLPDDKLPTVAFLVAAYNEEVVIETKLINCQKMDYPADKLKFVFVSDSNDSTNDILRRYASDQIQPHILTERVGKVRALCYSLPRCTGDLLVFSDANTYYHPDAVRKLVRHFQNPEIGVVTGDVRLTSSEERFGAGESLYYKYERGLQILESRYWSTVAVDGAMYALRREHFQAPSTRGVNDDMTTGLNVGLRGLRIIYDPEAVADEPATPSDEMEFERKVRIVAAGIQAALYREGVPSLRQWRLFWVFFSHKFIRWMAPLFLIGLLISNAICAALSGGIWTVLLAGEGLFYALAIIGWVVPGASALPFRIPYYFSMVNLGALLGIVRGLLKKQSPIWARTDRAPESRQMHS